MINTLFPFVAWLKDYNFEKLKIDSLSGLTVALVLIPQSMAYAQLAGMPAYWTLFEGPMSIAMGVIILLLARRV